MFFGGDFFLVLFLYALFALAFAKIADIGKQYHWLLPFDARVSDIFFAARSEWLTPIMQGVTHLGDVWFVAAALASVIFFLFFLGKRQEGIAAGIAVFVAYVSSFVFKDTLARPRPEGHELIVQGGFSFPSGHAIVALAFYGILVYFLCKHLPRKSHKALVVVCGGLVIGGIGVSRVYLGVHWPSDILGGYVLGGVWLAALIALLEKRDKKMNVPM